MKWAAIIVRTLVGLGFAAGAGMYFAKAMDQPPPPTEEAKAFAGVLVTTGYMTVVKVIELVGGLILLSGRYVPVGLVLLTPVAVNILLWDVLLAKQPALGVVFTLLLGFLIFAYRRCFVPDARL